METIKLKNGAEILEVLAKTEMMTLKLLFKKHPIAFYELVQICRNPGHKIFSEREQKILTELSIIEKDGSVRSETRDFVICAVDGESLDMKIVDPTWREGQDNKTWQERQEELKNKENSAQKKETDVRRSKLPALGASHYGADYAAVKPDQLAEIQKLVKEYVEAVDVRYDLVFGKTKGDKEAAETRWYAAYDALEAMYSSDYNTSRIIKTELNKLDSFVPATWKCEKPQEQETNVTSKPTSLSKPQRKAEMSRIMAASKKLIEKSPEHDR